MNIKTFLKNKIYPAKIYIALDSYSYTEEITDHINNPVRCPYEYLADDLIHLLIMYLDTVMSARSLKIILRDHDSPDNENFYKYGWFLPYGFKTDFDWDVPDIEASYGERFSDEILRSTLNDINEIVKLCRENKIELVIFINPMHNIHGLSEREKIF